MDNGLFFVHLFIVGQTKNHSPVFILSESTGSFFVKLIFAGPCGVGNLVTIPLKEQIIRDRIDKERR